jgi:enterochelin esterase-like enzyme
MSTSRRSLRGGRVRIQATSLIVATAAFLSAGLVGAYRYAHTYSLYRGFAPPSLRQAAREINGPTWATPSEPIRDGVVQKIYVWSPAVQRRQPVWVFLPPGYAEHPTARYPVIYLLHGFPGNPLSFFSVARAGLVQDVLVAAHRMEPMIEVVPYGSPGFLQDDEWVNGIAPASGWETFVARDVVNAIDARYRTIRSGSGRAIAGLSEGGYGALNIALHHPREFRVIESWSGYMWAGRSRLLFGYGPRRRLENSPMLTVYSAAPLLKASHAYIWFYIGGIDHLLAMNERFAGELSQLRIDHRFFVSGGAHSWALWRRFMADALMVASRHMAPS